jgi:hypothetical protein
MVSALQSFSARYRPYLQRVFWHEVGMIGLLLMEISWVLPWIRSVTPTTQKRGAFVILMVFLGFLVSVTYVNRLLRTLDLRSGIHKFLLVLILILGLFLLSRMLIYPCPGLGVSEVMRQIMESMVNVLHTIPEGFLILLMGLYLWWRGIALSSSGVLEIRTTERKFRIGILSLALYGLVFRGLEADYLIDAIPLYFASGLITVTLSRTSTLGKGMTAYRLPYTGSWFIGMLFLTFLTIGTGLLSGLILQSEPANLFFSYLSRAFNQFLVYLEILIIPLLEAVFFVIQKIIDFLSRFIKPGSLQDLLNDLQNADVPVFQLQDNGAASQPSAAVAVALVFLILGVLVFFILRRANRQKFSPIYPIYDMGETVIEQGEMRSRLQRLLDRIWGGITTFSKSQLRRRTLAAEFIRRIYTYLLDLAADLGESRHPADTPYEFERRLIEIFPTHKDQIALITDAYVQVRYGEIPEEEKMILAVEDAWLSIEKQAQKLERGVYRQLDQS